MRTALLEVLLYHLEPGTYFTELKERYQVFQRNGATVLPIRFLRSIATREHRIVAPHG
jgi:hypothetical protein